MGESFQERFNRKYKERAERTKVEYAQRNRLFDVYNEMVHSLFDLIERKVEGTPITVERSPVQIERRLSIFESKKEELPALKLKLQEYEISLIPEGINYQTGAASLRLEHNNPREQPQTLYLHLRVINESEDNPEGEMVWMIKIGFRNFSVLSEEILEKLIESIFLS
ncbi:MAG: hypothetical protein N2234_02535 [Planctomycetota bacterium]|nr:hypothetical protein [Planctomycetota bacterium]